MTGNGTSPPPPPRHGELSEQQFHRAADALLDQLSERLEVRGAGAHSTARRAYRAQHRGLGFYAPHCTQHHPQAYIEDQDLEEGDVEYSVGVGHRGDYGAMGTKRGEGAHGLPEGQRGVACPCVACFSKDWERRRCSAGSRGIEVVLIHPSTLWSSPAPTLLPLIWIPCR